MSKVKRRRDKLAHKGCKHLDYRKEKYPTCKLVETPEGWKWWERVIVQEGEPVKVQFCGNGRGRINGIFQCINPGEMGCYEAQEVNNEI